MSYRFFRKDFGKLLLQPLHYDLLFDVSPERVIVTAKQTYLYAGDAKTNLLTLNSHDLTIKSVSLFNEHSKLGPPPRGLDAKIPDFVSHVLSLKKPEPLKFDVLKDERFLKIHLPNELSNGDEIAIETVSVCHPTDNILEGIYFDYTAPGCPQQLITQCQQYGFQRIVPCVDQMPSKTFYTTTIIADERYTNLISNGDLAPGFFDTKTNEPLFKQVSEFLPDYVSEDYSAEMPKRKVVKYYNHKVNMSPYLFFLGCGTYEVVRREVEYPDGDSFNIEILTLPGISDRKGALEALDSLHDNIIWIFLSTGPEAAEHPEILEVQYALLKEREGLKNKIKNNASEKDTESKLAAVREKLAQNMKTFKKTGYKYTGTVYREIAMENSNYGGMENVGNTTIVSSKLAPTPWLLDGGYLYMEGVKVHEFYHNINGSQVTGQSPFEIWLNEAVTVHIQRQYEDLLFGADYMRLQKVKYAFTPGSGPLAQDRKPGSMAVEPVGFNMTNELVSAMTYSKAPEFVRMVELIIGKDAFNKALDHYHTKFAFANAATDDWIDCMADSSKEIDLKLMAKGWLKRTGYPTVILESYEYDAVAKTVTIAVKQTGDEDHVESERYPWIVPLDFAAVKDGENSQTGLFILQKYEDKLVINDVESEPDFISIGRDWSFFGDIHNKFSTKETTIKQAMSDPDTVNRFLAFQSIVDDEKAEIINQLISSPNTPPKPPSDAYLELYFRALTDSRLSPGIKAYFLNISESIPLRPEFQHHYQEIYEAKKSLLKAVYAKHGDVCFKIYKKLASTTVPGPQKDGLLERGLKSHLLDVLANGLEQTQYITLLKNLLYKSPFMSDQYRAFSGILNLETPLNDVEEEIKNKWTTHPIGCENYISCIACSDSKHTAKKIKELLQEPFFKLTLSGHARTVARGYSANRKRSLLTDEGLDLTVELSHKIGKTNQMSAFAFLSAFSDLKKFKGDDQKRLVDGINRIKAGLDPKTEESLCNQIDNMLATLS